MTQWTAQAEEKAIPKRSQKTFFMTRGIPEFKVIVYNEYSFL